jgi:protein-disulfide isomerase
MTLRALALAAALWPLPAAAFDPGDMTEAERAAFGAAVRAYLLENPEVLLEAIGVLEAREAEAQAAADRALVAEHLAAVQSAENAWVGGNPEGDVTVVEFFDYRCGHCRRAHPEFEAMVAADGGVRVVLREFPILGEPSLAAARFAIAVQQLYGDAAYKRAHDALMTMAEEVTEASLGRLAETLGLDPEPLLAHMGAAEVTAVIAANHALAEALRINGTPAFLFGDELVRGYIPRAQMEALVAAEREG